MRLLLILLTSTLSLAQITMSGGVTATSGVSIANDPVAIFLATVTGSGTTVSNSARSGVLTQTFGLTTHAPSWVSTGLSFSGLQYTTGTTSNTLTLNQASVYAAVKWIGSQQLSGYSPIVNTSDGAVPSLGLDAAYAATGTTGNQPSFRIGGQAVRPYAANLND